MLIKPKYRSHEHVRELENLLVQSDSENNLRLWKGAKSVLLYLKNKKPDEISDQALSFDFGRTYQTRRYSW